MYALIQKELPGAELHMAYGARTNAMRKELGIKKSHANDAYCIGSFHPKHCTDTEYFKKRRRNNRVLEKFYDARYVGLRDGETRHPPLPRPSAGRAALC